MDGFLRATGERVLSARVRAHSRASELWSKTVLILLLQTLGTHHVDPIVQELQTLWQTERSYIVENVDFVKRLGHCGVRCGWFAAGSTYVRGMAQTDARNNDSACTLYAFQS